MLVARRNVIRRELHRFFSRSVRKLDLHRSARDHRQCTALSAIPCLTFDGMKRLSGLLNYLLSSRRSVSELTTGFGTLRDRAICKSLILRVRDVLMRDGSF